MTRLTVAALFGLTVFAAAPAAALVPLHQNERVVNSFYAIGLADEVRKNCPSISPRLLRAYNYLKSIESYARNAGYSDAQIEDLTENKAEKEKLRAKVRADLVRRGAKPGSPEGYCSVGREEIKNDTASGRLLKEN
ncbi:DUF5333 domain-containing protein [Oceaniovalibus sp. ACAM 378]|jgi:hypothetical protein|uniref:DUF5333 domain-containing protein n=1 Tax=Oceaniovalibus sp. ACAM 378 TaxID=2599923 RepID=UPI0011D4F353|nr:DUF5333 domain-containing protein [Oceaniovalibus sp. ACAM 378]TYB91253.1 hypothetical protein FQ320_01805 [Oceaniovalibus sp. ACAM 378]